MTMFMILFLFCLGFIVLAVSRLVSERKAKQEAIRREEERRKHILDLYGPEDGRKIIDGEMWRGMTQYQVLDAFGPPDQSEERALQKVDRQVFKYRRGGKIWLQINIDNGAVSGWTRK